LNDIDCADTDVKNVDDADVKNEKSDSSKTINKTAENSDPKPEPEVEQKSSSKKSKIRGFLKTILLRRNKLVKHISYFSTQGILKGEVSLYH
jgi:hypothetical protein